MKTMIKIKKTGKGTENGQSSKAKKSAQKDFFKKKAGTMGASELAEGDLDKVFTEKSKKGGKEEIDTVLELEKLYDEYED